MARLGLEIVTNDKQLLARNVRVKVDGQSLLTPSRVLGATRTSSGDLAVLSYDECKSLTTFAEIYSAVTVEKLESCLEDNGKRLEFETEVDRTLKRALDARQVPYLMVSVQDNNGDPLNDLPPDQELEYLLDLLWRPTNCLVLVPLFGNLRTMKPYDAILSQIKDRLATLGPRPLAATIPSVYRSLTRTLLEKYWRAGMRVFALDLEGRSMGAQGTVITLVNATLRKLSKEDGDRFLLIGLNVKDHVGTGQLARLHNLIGHAYGFDVVGLNRVRRKGWSGATSQRGAVMDSIRFLQAGDYGYLNVEEMQRLRRKGLIVETDTPPLKDLSLETLRRMQVEYVRRLAKLHNAVKDQREESQFRQKIEAGSLEPYLSKKKRVQADLDGVKKVAYATRSQREL